MNKGRGNYLSAPFSRRLYGGVTANAPKCYSDFGCRKSSHAPARTVCKRVRALSTSSTATPARGRRIPQSILTVVVVLARAVYAQQKKQIPTADGQVQPVNRGHISEPLCQPRNLDRVQAPSSAAPSALPISSEIRSPRTLPGRAGHLRAKAARRPARFQTLRAPALDRDMRPLRRL